MAVVNDPNVSTNINRVGEVATGATGAQHAVAKPIPSSVGHYKGSVRFALVNAQAANSRLWTIRNTHATNLIIPTRLTVRWLQTAAHTAAIRDSLDLFKCTTFSVVDTTNTVTPTVSLARTSMTATSAAIRHVTIAGASAGMTGGTLTKDTNANGIMSKWLLAAVPTGGDVPSTQYDFLSGAADGTHPFVFIQNEGLELENSILLGAAAGSDVGVDFSFAEVTAY